MMIAMMTPSAAPLVLLYERVLRSHGAQATRSSVYAPSVYLLFGYLSVWLVFSVAAAALQYLLAPAGLISPMMLWSRSGALSAGVLAAAGLYQLSPLKRACLVRCRAPVQFLTRHWRPGRGGAFAMGVRHGAWCVGCCWMLMALLFVGGIMNLAWIALLTLLVLIEKLARPGLLAGRIAGVLLLIWAAATAAFIAPPAHAQGYPTKPVRVVSPYPPGSSADLIGRIYAPKLGEALGRPFIVDNRSGASGNIAGELVARAAPDGYTLLLLNSPIATSPLIIKNVPFDAQRDFQPAGMLGLSPHFLVVNNALPVKNVKELVALAKSRPGKLVYASTGIGGTLHLAMESFKLQTGTDMLHVPYKGSATTVPDMIGGRIDVMFGSVPALIPHVRGGRIRPIGIATLKRSPMAPDIPTIAEAGLPGFESVSFTSLAAPVKTPRNIIALLNSTIADAAKSAEVSAALANQGTDLALMSPDEIRIYIRDQIAKWKKVVIAAGVQAE